MWADYGSAYMGSDPRIIWELRTCGEVSPQCCCGFTGQMFNQWSLAVLFTLLWLWVWRPSICWVASFTSWLTDLPGRRPDQKPMSPSAPDYALTICRTRSKRRLGEPLQWEEEREQEAAAKAEIWTWLWPSHCWFCFSCFEWLTTLHFKVWECFCET